MNMSKAVLVSAVIPVYNGARFIEDALESVLAQTHPIHEIVVIDDGSTDATQAIVLRYAQRGVRLVQQDRQGPSAARNRGIAETSSELIAFLDADDAWLPDKIAKQVNFLLSHQELGLVSCDTLWWHAERNIRRIIRRGVAPGLSQMHEIAVRNFVGNTSHVLIRRSLIDLLGGFDAQLRWCEDWELWSRIISHQPVGFLNEPLVLYRWHSDGNAHQRRWERSIVVFEVSRRAISRVYPLWRRPVLLARAKSMVELQRARYAITEQMPRSAQLFHSLLALTFSPLEDTSAKLGLLIHALLGKRVYQVLQSRKPKKTSKNEIAD